MDITPAGVPDKFAVLGLTFDDVLLQPNESDVIPSEVSTKSRVSRNIEVNIPLLSSAMDTVTEASESCTATSRSRTRPSRWIWSSAPSPA